MLSAVLLAGGLGMACQPAAEPTVLAMVNGKPITEMELDYRWSELPPATKTRYRQEGGKRRFLDDLITRELLLQEARRRGLDQTLAMRERLARLKEQLLLDELTRQVADGATTATPLTEAEFEAYRVAHSATILSNEQIRLAHIVVTTMDQAKEIRQQVDQGYDFGKLAQKYSTDSTTKTKGGDLGVYRKGVLDGDIEPVLLKLKAGQVSEPLPMPSGVHLVKVVSREVLNPEEAQATRERMQRELHAEKVRKRFQDFVASLKSTASIRLADASRLVADDVPHEAPSKP